MGKFQHYPTFAYEKDIANMHQPGAIICGVDEVGRGAWAGPVIVAAVILRSYDIPEGLRDSKALSVKARIRIAAEIYSKADVAFGASSRFEIDKLNILQATCLAMRRAVHALKRYPDHIMIDGNYTVDFGGAAVTTIVEGDKKSASIAAASVVAKVLRDRLMQKLAVVYPWYQWEKNAGYGVKAHRDAIYNKGITSHHRRSFKPIRNYINDKVV